MLIKKIFFIITLLLVYTQFYSQDSLRGVIFISEGATLYVKDDYGASKRISSSNNEVILSFGTAKVIKNNFAISNQSNNQDESIGVDKKEAKQIVKTEYKKKQKKEADKKADELKDKLSKQKINIVLKSSNSTEDFNSIGGLCSKSSVIPTNVKPVTLTGQELQLKLKKLERIYIKSNFHYLSNIGLLNYSKVFSVRPPPFYT